MDASAFLLAVLQIVMIDILLGGDNAVVIALAFPGWYERGRNLLILDRKSVV